MGTMKEGLIWRHLMLSSVSPSLPFRKTREGGDVVETQGWKPKIRKFVKTLMKIVGNLVHRFFPRNRYVKKFSNYL
jgi:hypothetical protein